MPLLSEVTPASAASYHQQLLLPTMKSLTQATPPTTWYSKDRLLIPRSKAERVASIDTRNVILKKGTPLTPIPYDRCGKREGAHYGSIERVSTLRYVGLATANTTDQTPQDY